MKSGFYKNKWGSFFILFFWDTYSIFFSIFAKILVSLKKLFICEGNVWPLFFLKNCLPKTIYIQ